MWNRRKYEDQILDQLNVQFDPSKAEGLFAVYQSTRDKLIGGVFGEVKGAEPNLSDHSSTHIANVLDNAYALLAEKNVINSLDGIELYCLGMVILFHDVGNLFGRADHQKKIAEVYDWARGTDAAVKREKVLVLKAAKAHTGKTPDGSTDTLKLIGQEDHLGGARVRLQDLAAVLRFADELAEGPQRTSEFMRTRGLYEGNSQIFHDYASVTNVHIDRGNQRIALTYELDVAPPQEDSTQQALRTMLEFVYRRVIKLDQERRYARFYSDLLAPFKATWVTLNFHCKGQLLEFNQAPLRLDDKIVPGDLAKSIPDLDASYEISTLMVKVADQAKEVE